MKLKCTNAIIAFKIHNLTVALMKLWLPTSRGGSPALHRASPVLREAGPARHPKLLGDRGGGGKAESESLIITQSILKPQNPKLKYYAPKTPKRTQM